MNILFDIGHPGHVHLLKHTIHSLKSNGHKILITVKNIPVAKKLLSAQGFAYIDLGSKTDSIFGKALKQLQYSLKIAKIVSESKIDLGIGSSITLAHVSRFTKMKSIILDDDDDDVQPLFVKYGHPFADAILTPDSIKRKSKKSIYYAGSHELAYLHPSYFMPKPQIIEAIGIAPGDKFFVMRFVALKGHHDIGHAGISYEQKKMLIELVKPYGKIFITSEKEIEPEFEAYRLPVAPENIHSLMYYATMFLADSQTMTSEAAILGTPALKCNTFAGKLSVPNELEEKYGLCYSYQPSQFEAFYNHAKELLQKENIKEEWRGKRERLLQDKIDVTSFFVWFIENWPACLHIIKENPEFQYNFK